MSRVNQIVSNTNTIVKKIVVGTPIKRVSGTLNNIRSTGAEDGQILVYDSASQTFRPEFFSDRFANLRARINAVLDSDQIRVLVDSSYVTSRVNPNLLPDVIIDSNAIQRIVDSSYVLLRSPSGVDSAAVTSIIDSAYINARVPDGIQSIVDSAYILARSPAPTIDSAGVLSIVDSSYIKNQVPVLNELSINDSGNGILITKNLVPATYNLSLGTIKKPWKDLYLSANSRVIGGVKISADSGSLQVNQIVVDSQGEEVVDAPPVAASFSVSDSDIQAITSFTYSTFFYSVLISIMNNSIIMFIRTTS